MQQTQKRKLYHTYALIILCAIIGIVVILYILLMLDRVHNNTTIVVARGANIAQVSKTLEERKIIIHRYMFHILLYLQKNYVYNYMRNISNKNTCALQAGEYQIKKGYTVLDIFNTICSGHVVPYYITVPEGLTTHQIANLLYSTNYISHDSLPVQQVTTQFREGYLMPDTYSYTIGTNVAEIMRMMHSKMEDFLEKEWPKRDTSIDDVIKSTDDAVILASIVEKEVFFRDEGPQIASVYINRLRSKMLLQACPTVIYGITKGETQWNRKLTYRDLRHNSKHNTYKYSNLPPTAICNPGKRSILAVLHPAKTNYLYFVADIDKHHMFSSTYSSHNAKINALRKQTQNLAELDATTQSSIP